MTILFSENISCIITAGGYQNKTATNRVEVLTGYFGTKRLQNLPFDIPSPSMTLHNGTILLNGGINNLRNCLQLDHGTWKQHSNFEEYRINPSVVTTKTATFLFGGEHLGSTYEYLPKDSNTWFKGKNAIPGGFWKGCAIAVKSDQEIWLIGGIKTGKRILSFSVNDHTFQELPIQLNVARFGQQCAFIPNTNKLIITGGKDYTSFLDSSEILDTSDRSINMGSKLNSKRRFHGMGVITINGKDKLAVLGGHDGKKMLDCVEVYNTKTQKWETTDLKLNEPKEKFGFLTIKLGDLIANLADNPI